jgi:tRNA threonylcarbamoyl adenosine modification protein YeaZ
MMALLSLYSQHNQCFIALKAQETLCQDSLTLDQGMTQATALVPFIQKVWQQAGNPPLTGIITPRGPGAFTSLRVTLATAQGLACVFPQAKIFAPTHFEVLAYAGLQGSLSKPSPILVLIDSKRGEWYGQLYPPDFPNRQVVETPTILNNDSLKELLDNNPSYRIVADFNLGGDFEPFVISDLGNLAVAQIDLFEGICLKTEGQLDSCYQALKPYYFYQPNYVKKRNITSAILAKVND